MTVIHGELRIDLRLSDGFRIRTERLDLIPAQGDLAAVEWGDRARLSELLAADVPGSWPPALVEGPHSEDVTEWWNWYVVKREPAEVIGVMGVRGWPVVTGEIQVGCSFVLDCQRQGYGTEAVEALTRWALDQPEIAKVVAEIPAGHSGSETILRRLGFQMAAEDAAYQVFEKTK